MEGIASVTTYLYIGFGVMILLGFGIGLLKGLFRTLVDLGFTVINLIASTFIAIGTAKSIATPSTISEALNAFVQTIGADAATLETINDIQMILNNPEANAKALNLIVALVAVIILPLVFLAVFLALGLVLKIPKLLIELLIIPKAKNWGLRFAGGGVGIVCNIISLIITLMPLVGYLNYANDTFEMLKSEPIIAVEADGSQGGIILVEDEQIGDGEGETANSGSALDATIDSILSVTKPLTDNFILKTVQNVGGRALFETLTTIQVDDTTVSLSNETKCGIQIYKEIGHFTVPFEQYGSEQVESLTRIEQIINEAEFMPSLIANTLSFVATEWDAGRDFMGITKPTIGTELQEGLDNVIHVLASSTKDTFKEDVTTVTGILKECINDGVISTAIEGDPGKVIEMLDESDIISDVLVALHKNERLRPTIPGITKGIINYIYKVYDEVNGTVTPPSDGVNADTLTDEDVRAEGELITDVVIKLDKFLASIEAINLESEEGMYEILEKGDFASLGQSLNHLKDSYLLGDIFEFLLSAVLKSEACSTLGIVDDMFIENATKENADLEKMLVARQNLAKLILALKDNDTNEYNNAIEKLLLAITTGESESLRSVLTYNNLRSLGLSTEKAKTVSGLLTSMVNSVDGSQYTNEEAVKEAESTGKIVNAVNAALENKDLGGNVFNSESGADDGLSNITADEFVSTAIDSSLVSSMIGNAITDEEGNIVDDPYHIHDKMSEDDLSAIENALKNEFNKEGTKEDEEKLEKLENIAHILGIDTSELFK